MARKNFAVEKGLDFYETDGEAPVVSVLKGSGAPGSLPEHDAAAVGSIYLDYDVAGQGYTYRKKTAGTGLLVWERYATKTDLLSIKFRSEKVIAVTGDIAPAEGATIDLAANPFGDDEAPLLSGADFSVDDYVIFGQGGTPVLAKVTNVAGDVLTFTLQGFDALEEDDKFTCLYYLPDVGDDQEKSALVIYNGTDIEKIGDLNWNFADGIGLNSPYVAAAGTVTDADNVQSALQKIDGNQKSILLSLGISQGAVDFGTFTGSVLSDGANAKTLFQELEDYVEGLASPVEAAALNVAAPTTIDSVLTSDVAAALWLTHARETSAPNQNKVTATEIFAAHDRFGTTDAASVDDTIYAKLKLNGGTKVKYSVDISGTGAAQVLRLRAQSSIAVDIRTTRVRVAA